MKDRIRLWAVVVGGPVAIAVIGMVVARGVQDRLPDPVAIHWGADGRADGFASASTAVLLTGLGGLIGLVVGTIALWHAGQVAVLRRLGAGLGVGVAAFVTVLSVQSLWAQRGLPVATGAPAPGWGIAWGLLIGVALGVLAGWLVPTPTADAATARDAIPSSAPRADLPDSSTAAWSGYVGPPVAVLAVLGAAALVALAAVVAGLLPVLVAVLLVVATALTMAMLAFHVLVGDAGLVVRSLLGWPVVRVPLREVAGAEARAVSPLRDFGGWGVRGGFRKGRLGVVVRSGDALDVTKGDGMHVVVTVDGAGVAAGLLNTLAERQRHTQHP